MSSQLVRILFSRNLFFFLVSCYSLQVFAQVPTISGFSPSSGPVGSLVTITGSNLSNPTAFSIGGTQALVISNTGTSLVGFVMPGVINGNISITTAGGTGTSGSSFTVLAPQAITTQMGDKVSGSGNIGAANQGLPIALSADGNTAIIGGNDDNSSQGAAWIFTKINGFWNQQGLKLIGTGNVGPASQGLSVALSADGNTAALGGSFDDGGKGAVWVFTRTGSTWTQQGPKLTVTGSNNAAAAGSTLSLSADGNTLLTGAPTENLGVGAGWIFTRSSGVWTQQAKLTATGNSGTSQIGFSVSLSADGNTAAMGGYEDFSGMGAAWVFTRSGTVWTQQGSKLVGTGNIGNAKQGSSVALNANGNYLIVGGGLDDGEKGAAWVYTRSGSAWTQQTKLVGTGASAPARQGSSVSINADGSRAAVGGYLDNFATGSVWLFNRTGSTWNQTSKTTGAGASGSSAQGLAVSISADGQTLGIGGPADNFNNGAAWFFGPTPPAPTITSFTPTTGSDGVVVNLTGTNFTGTTAVSFGGTPAQEYSVVNGTTITAMVAAGTSGSVSVTTPGGTGTLAGFTYSFSATPTITSFSPVTGYVGSLVTITGTNLLNPSVFTIGGTPALVISSSATKLVGLVMPGTTTGLVNITTAGGSVASSGNITINPSLNLGAQQGNKLVGSGFTGPGQQGYSVALSADGNTAIVGAPNDDGNKGAAWIYIRTGNNWTQQGPKLTGFGATGNAEQGVSVAISADGNTALVGGWKDDLSTGAAWVFTRTGTTWTQQGGKLIGAMNSGASQQGFSVALSGNGNTAVLGGKGDNGSNGAIWIFTRSGSVWSPQGSKLTVSNNIGAAQLGHSVALSTDGNTMAAGGYSDDSDEGATWIFTRSGSVWSQQAKLKGNLGSFANQGQSVALNANGNTLLIGGNFDNAGVGAAWVFTRTGSTWTQQGGKLTPTGATGPSFFGQSVALSADGNTASIGGENDNSGIGAGWVFRRTGSTWAQSGIKLVGTDFIGNGKQGWATTVSADANTLMLGGNLDNSNRGAVWVFSQPGIPVISSYTPILAGIGNIVTISGSNFSGTTSVTFGGTNATAFTVVNNSTILATVGTGTSGSVSVITPGGTSGLAGFTFIPAPTISSFSPTSAGTGAMVTLTGTNFTGATVVSFGGTAAISFTVVNATTITAVVSSGVSGNVSVTTPGGSANLAGFTFVGTPGPAITSFSPSSGCANSAVITITGSNFTGAATVSIGGTAVNSFTVNSATQITATVGNGTTGTIQVTTIAGTGTSSGVFTVNPLPGAAGAITGTPIVCQGQNGVAYSVPTIANATGYIWTRPTGTSIASGNNTNSITLNYSASASSGDVAVQGTNSCGSGPSSGLPGINDPSFNPMDVGFGNGDGASFTIYSNVLQPDGKIIIGGGFSTYSGTNRPFIARLNADGTLDATFNPSTTTNSFVYSIALQSDGKIIIGGEFITYNGMSRNRITRLNPNGTLDATFNPGTGANFAVWTIALQSDGKIIIGGEFTTYNGISRNRIARLNADGTLDATFDPGTGANNQVLTSALQSDGKLIIGGNFITYNGTSRNHIARLNADGTLDASFNPGGPSTTLLTTALQPDGKIVIGGNFTFVNGTSRNRIARLNADGTLDASFNPGSGASTSVFTTILQSDGKIIIGGGFTIYNGTSRNRIARLNADGTVDATFNPGAGADNNVRSASIQADGKIIVGGDFTAYNGTARSFIARLNADGTVDATSFYPGTGANNEVWTSTIQPDGKIIIGGTFSAYNGMSRTRIARLNADGTVDATFNPGIGASSTVLATAHQPDGKIIIGGAFTSYNGATRNRIARLNADGNLDASFDPGIGADDEMRTTALQPDGKIIIGGNFTTFNGTSRNRIARLNADGTLDATFYPGTGANVQVRATALQSDGKIIIGGDFTNFNGTSQNYIARLNADGSLDASFNSGTGANNFVNTISIQTDGKILIGGWFTTYNGTSRNRIARLNADGSLDATFNPGSGANTIVLSILLQPDGKIIIGGAFGTYNSTSRNRIARLNADGSLDGTFNPGTGANNSILTTGIQQDGKIIIGGAFTGYNGAGRNRLARIFGSGFRVTVNPLPSPGGTITGTATVSAGQNGVGYSVPAIANATGYTWSLPVGVSIASGNNTNSITVNFSGSAGSGNISVAGTNSCGSGTNSTAYAVTVLPLPPTITSFTPTSATTGTTVTITGTNFTGASSVSFGGTNATSYMVVNATTITAVVSSGASGNVSVTTPGGTASLAGFTFISSIPAPVISSFNPLSGQIGTLVTISGLNFSPIPSNNQVFFGSIRATVSTATTTSLTVLVPVGTTYDPVSVTVGGLTGFSRAAFNVTFPGGTGSFSNSSFAPKVDFSTGFSDKIYSLDVDLDGKHDLVILYPNSTLGIRRNTAISGSITPSSFSSEVIFPTGLITDSWSRLVCEDFDGDGRKDLAFTNADATFPLEYKIGILRNNSSPGSIAFGPTFEIAMGTSSMLDIAATDLDADGKPDIAVVQNGLGASVVKNNSTIGSFSFNSPITYSDGFGLFGIALGDLDGDGKPDIVTANFNNRISIYQNIGIPGIINATTFGTRTDYTVIQNPNRVFVRDIDQDGKLDIITSRPVSGNTAITYFQNQSVTGSILIGSAQNISVGSAPGSMDIEDMDGDGKPDIFVVSQNENKFSAIRNTSTLGTIGFLSQFDYFPPTSYSGITNSDYDGDGKNDIAIVSLNTQVISVYRNIIGENPTIISFTPTSAGAGTTVTLTGTNFTGATAVTFGGAAASSFTVVNATTITAVVGLGASGNASVTTPGGTANLAGFTFISAPTITSFTPTTAGTGTTITITGTNFTGATAVSFGGTAASSFTVVNANTITAVVGSGSSGNVSVTTLGGTVSLSGFVLTTLSPTISSFSPTTGAVGTLVTILGNNLIGSTSLKFGGVEAIPISNNGTTLVALVMPGSVTGNVSVTTLGGISNSLSNFVVIPTPFPAQQQGLKLVGSGSSGLTEQGCSVAVSADGNTAVIGGYLDNSNQGAIWIFTRTGTVWNQQGSKLTCTGNIGAAQLGISVAISSDGNTVIAGGLNDNTGQGAAWVFTRNGTTWSQQGTKLVGTGSVGFAGQGSSVALSADGNTAIIGASNDNSSVGAAWVFIRSGVSWNQQGSKIIGSNAIGTARLGSSVALSADGNTALVGGSGDNSNQGAIWIFTRSGGVWVQQGLKLIGTGANGIPKQGSSVSLSADGNTALSGGFGDNLNRGAVWIFTRTGGVWSQQGGKLVGSASVGSAWQGRSVSLTADGNTAVLGGYLDNSATGAVWVFTRSANSWSQQGIKLVGTGGLLPSGQGFSVSISSDGSTTLVGGSVDNSNLGATWVFTPGVPPSISSFTPTTAGPGTTVTITGTNFTGASAVSFGGTAAGSFTVVNATTITAVVGSGASGSVSVTTPGGTASLVGFTFIPAPTITSFTPNSAGTGTTVTITGSNFTGATSVSFGGTAAGSFTVVNATTITAVVASGTSGSVTVTTPGGTASLVGFTFIPAPTITSFTPNSAGTGITVTITGTNFTGATAVSFGGTAATTFNVVNSTTITAVVSTGTSGNVSVTTLGGTSSLAGFTFIGTPLSPTITSFTPTSAGTGTTVTITGTNFTGASAVSFGGTTAGSFTVVNATTITAVVASGTSGSVTVTTPGGTASLAGFTFTTGPLLNTWNGTGNWNTPSNWSFGTVPLPSESVVIGSGVATVSDNIAIQNLTVSPGTTVHIQAGFLFALFGNSVSIQGIIEGDGLLEITGSSPVISSGASARVHNLRFNTFGGTASLQNPFRLTGTLKLQSGILQTNGNLILVSNATGSARISKIEESNGADIIGDVTWQRHVPGPAGWRFIGTPIQNQNLPNWTDNFPVNTNSYFIHNEGGTLNSGNQVNGWESSIGGGVVGKGYRVFLNSAFMAGPSLFDNKGLITKGLFPFNLSFTPSGYGGGGWNFLANPYPCEVDWHSFNRSPQVGAAIHIFNKTAYGSYSAGSMISINGVTGYIEQGQGFFVKTTDNSATLSVTEDAKPSTNQSTGFLRTAFSADPVLKFFLQTQNGDKDEMAICFREDATDGYDKELDAHKFDGGLALSAKGQNLTFSIQCLNLPEGQTKVIPLKFRVPEAGIYSIRYELERGEAHFQLWLRDLDNSTIVPFQSGQTISFSTSSTVSDGRFELVVAPETTAGIKELNQSKIRVFPNPASNNLFIESSDQKLDKIEIFNLLGKRMYSTGNPWHEVKAVIQVKDYPKGLYLIRIQSPKGTEELKVLIQ